MQYDFIAIEKKWQDHWAAHKTFRTTNPGDPAVGGSPAFDPSKPKFYVLDMFPYPSGVGLHVGHPLGYIATDIVARYKRMRGFNVLHPMGYDAFGLPAEQFAVEHGVHPAVTTAQNIANMTRQLKQLGLSYDWDRAISTTDPDYYRWTQWIFLRLFNSYFDPAQKKARPITDLLAALEGEDYFIGIDNELVVAGSNEDLQAIAGTPVGVRKWTDLTNEERADFLDSQRLAFLDEVPVNWCPALGTVLANEEVTNDGRSERGNYPVFKRPLKQWMLRITAYGDRLADDLDFVDWPEAIKKLQRDWIGRSTGARVEFAIAFDSKAPEQPGEETITVFTTRPDTLFGATYLVLAPEHPLVEIVTAAEQYHAVNQYRVTTAAKTDVDRQAEALKGEKTGAFTGAYAINPVNNAKVPIWIADYVMMGYGTGAIMAVPAHDERDFAFAAAMNLPVVAVVMPTDAWLTQRAKTLGWPSVGIDDLRNRYLQTPREFGEAYVGAGANVNSANDEISLDGRPTDDAKLAITKWLAARSLGRPTVQYKLRDWLFSRQRYWGEPFPVLHSPDGRVVAIDDAELPVLLPELSDFRPTASDDPNAPVQPPLGRAAADWKTVTRAGVTYTREFNTMPQWAGSCWYYLRFIDPKNNGRFVAKDAEAYWMGSGKGPKGQGVKGASDVSPPSSSADPSTARPHSPSSGGVDLYVGGVEHAVLHLLYARFWHKVLFDLGEVSTPEPFGRLFNQGYIQAYYYEDERGVRCEATKVVDQDGRPAPDVQDEPNRKFFYEGKPVTQRYGKMGKSLKNAVAPDDICVQYGCDTLRLYEMYLGPLDQSKVWSTRDIVGVHRFLQRLWRAFVDENTGRTRVCDSSAPDDLRRLLHKTIKRVTEAMDNMAFNVAIAALIELNNEVVKRQSSDASGCVHEEVAEAMALLLSPMAPHIAEELWQRLGHVESLARHPWPVYDPALLIEDSVEYPVQVNGKLRGRVTVPATADNAEIERAALSDEKVAASLGGKPPKKVIVVRGKMVNIVA